MKMNKIKFHIGKKHTKPPYDPAIPTPRHIPLLQFWKPKLKKTHVSQCSLQHYLQ